jgi:hypothetical protein
MRHNPNITNISNLSNVSKSRSKSAIKKVNFVHTEKDSKKTFDNRIKNNLGILNTANKQISSNLKEKKKKNKSEEIKKIKKKSKVPSHSVLTTVDKHDKYEKQEKHNSRSHSYLNKKIY